MIKIIPANQIRFSRDFSSRFIRYVTVFYLYITLYYKQAGDLWERDEIKALKKEIEDGGLAKPRQDGSTVLAYEHGRMLWGEKAMPGYGLYDRALGAAYICCTHNFKFFTIIFSNS